MPKVWDKYFVFELLLKNNIQTFFYKNDLIFFPFITNVYIYQKFQIPNLICFN
jgi:hypothetical protein